MSTVSYNVSYLGDISFISICVLDIGRTGLWYIPRSGIDGFVGFVGLRDWARAESFVLAVFWR